MIQNGNESLNVIYLDENLKFEGIEIIHDSQKIQRETKCTLILVDELLTLNILLDFLSNNKTKSKFVFLVNGSSSEQAINLINSFNYKSLFINACIYTKIKKNYLNIMERNSNFVGKICTDCRGVINFLKDTSNKIKEKKEKYIINNIINFNSYKEEYFILHKLLSHYYGDLSEGTFKAFFKDIQDFMEKETYSESVSSVFLGKSFYRTLDSSTSLQNELINSFKEFSCLIEKQFEKIISIYIKNGSFSKYLNSLLITKNIQTYGNIGYFVGNLMYSIVQYGKKERKGVIDAETFYKGLQLNIIEVLEYLKNRNLLIAFPYFFSMTTKKNIAELMSKRNNIKRNKNIFSVIMKIQYLHDEGYEPCAFDLSDLSEYPDEEEYILLPFTFLYINNISINSEKFNVDIDLEIIGKSKELEPEIKENRVIEYDEKQHIMFAK